MGLGKIVGQRRQPTSTNVQEQTNANKNYNLYPKFGKFAGRKVVEGTIKKQKERIEHLEYKQCDPDFKSHMFYRVLHNDHAKGQMEKLVTLKERANYILNDDTQGAGASTHHKNSPKWSRKYNIGEIDASLNNAKGLKKLALRAERGMKSFYNQTIPKQKLANISNEIGVALEQFNKSPQRAVIDPGRMNVTATPDSIVVE